MINSLLEGCRERSRDYLMNLARLPYLLRQTRMTSCICSLWTDLTKYLRHEREYMIRAIL